MIDKYKNVDFKKKIQDHFDKKQLKVNLNDFIPYSISEYFRNPFVYIQDNYCRNINGKKTLDYCCGSGLNSVFFSKMGAKVTGIDISKESIHVAKQRFKKHNLKDYDFFQMDAHALNFEDDYFDVIICYKSLLYLNLDKAFKELNRVLKHGGKLIILENIGDNFIFNYYRLFKHIFKSRKYLFELNKLKSKDLNISDKFFNTQETVYFDFFSIFGKLIKDVLKIKISNKLLNSLDVFILRKLKVKFLAFTVVKILTKK
jgi:ubiquinone/menaquinone biosynthesis C-methylase UbiE